MTNSFDIWVWGKYFSRVEAQTLEKVKDVLLCPEMHLIKCKVKFCYVTKYLVKSYRELAIYSIGLSACAMIVL